MPDYTSGPFFKTYWASLITGIDGVNSFLGDISNDLGNIATDTVNINGMIDSMSVDNGNANELRTKVIP